MLLILALAVLAGATRSTNSTDYCNPSCRLSIVESIPENLTFSYGAPMQYSTYQSWMDLLSAAKKSVDIASFYWTLQSFNDTSDVTDKQGQDVFNSLSSLHSRGVSLRIVQNPPDKYHPQQDSKLLTEQYGAQVQNLYFDRLMSGGVLHTKLWVIDEQHFYLGSANMDWRSLTQVKELGLLGMNCDCLAWDLQRLFDVYWYLSTPRNQLPPADQWPDQFTALYNMQNPAHAFVNNTVRTLVYFASSPPPFCASERTGDIDALLNVINSAKQFVYVAVMDYEPAIVFSKNKKYWGVIDDALRAAAFRNVSVRLMGSYWNHTDCDMLHFLSSLSDDSGVGYRGSIATKMFVVPELTNKNIPFTRVNHNKYMVTETTAYVGTSNWSGDYFINTGGLSCILNSTSSYYSPQDSIQHQLLEVFERDWNSIYNHDLNTIWSTSDCQNTHNSF